MSTDAIARFVAGWIALVAMSIVLFGIVERTWPRHHVHPGARRIALAAALLAINAVLAQVVVRMVDVRGNVVLGWFAFEVAHYGVHRAMHRVPLLWRLHRVHHDGGALAWTTTWLLHPLDAVMTAGAGIAAAAAVGAGLPSAAAYVVGRRIWSIVLHANVRWPASALDAVIATPVFHARHHREDLPPANFAATLPVLDRLFGTYRRHEL